MWPQGLKLMLHFFVVVTLHVIEFGHTQINVTKVGIPMLKVACINPWKSRSWYKEVYILHQLELVENWHGDIIFKFGNSQ